MRTRSQSRKLAGYLPAGSGPSGGSGARLGDPAAVSGPSGGSNPRLPEATATANQLRRCCGESGRPRIEAKSRLREWCVRRPRSDPRRSDWANLPTELVEEIATRLLTVDVSEYLRLRSACKAWRKCTDDPSLSGGGLDPRFRPHQWIAVSYCASPSRRRLINTCTGARAEVDRPELSTHHCFGIVDGLLVLCDKASSAVRLLNPLSGALVDFPAITDVRDTQEEPLTEEEEEEEEEEERGGGMRFLVNDTPKKKNLDPSGATKINVPKPSAINGAAIDDDSTTPPTLVLALRSSLFRIICAKPGDEYWVNVHSGEQCEPVYNNKGCILFHSLLSFRGHCYVTTHEGLVMRVDLRGPPRLVYLSRSRDPMAVSSRSVSCISYLLRSQDHRMLMVRFLSYIEPIEPANMPYPSQELITTRDDGYSFRVEVFEVDVVGRRLIPLNSIGKHYAAFVGRTYTVMLPTDKFPKLAPNAVYVNYYYQDFFNFGIYHFKDRRISPPRDFTRNRWQRLFPCACHWELADYLIVDADRR